MRLEQAQAMIDAAVEHARAAGVAMSFAVVDAGGHLVALSRMDGASFLTAETAQAKAWTAAASKMPTIDLVRALEAGMSSGAASLITSTAVFTHGRFMAAAGGMPVFEAGEVVGAIGVSGGDAATDLASVKAALDSLS